MQHNVAIPGFKKRLFWEYNYDKIDWQKSFVSVIGRVIERGTHEEWDILTRFYGRQLVTDIIKTKIKSLPDEIMEDVCIYFTLNKEDLLCYRRRQSGLKHWF
ncbi:DUF6922 domain-containing protein [Arachidicoccus sp.]|jgi:hypothetical protein|uniref:DUF6922 domain-containing protein n=1 Tax=Arachidicoccus sp. TaxID=1872624 RepID=UPI003D20A50F